MDRAALFDDLASPGLCLTDVAARHGLTLEALSTYLASEQAQQTIHHIQSVAAIRTRLIAQLRLPIAIAALTTLLQSHRAAAIASHQPGSLVADTQQPGPICTNAHQAGALNANPQHAGSLNAPASDQSNSSSATPPTPRDQARTLRHQVELRRAATTLIRFANFNHRALARAHTSEPRHASVPREPSRTFDRQHVNAAPYPARASAPTDPPPGPPQVSPTSNPSRDPASHVRAQNVEPHTAPVPSSTPITSPSPAAAPNLISSSPSAQSPSTPSIPFPALPTSVHLAPFNPSSSASPRFLRASECQWFVPSSSPGSLSRPSAAERLASAAGAPSRPP